MTLTEWRAREELSMTKAAERLGLHQSTISRIEAGKLWPDKETMQQIVEATDGMVTPNDFIAVPAEGAGA